MAILSETCYKDFMFYEVRHFHLTQQSYGCSHIIVKLGQKDRSRKCRCGSLLVGLDRSSLLCPYGPGVVVSGCSILGSFIATVFMVFTWYLALRCDEWRHCRYRRVMKVRSTRKVNTERGYAVVETIRNGALVSRFVERHEESISKAFPEFSPEQLADARAFFIMHH